MRSLAMITGWSSGRVMTHQSLLDSKAAFGRQATEDSGQLSIGTSWQHCLDESSSWVHSEPATRVEGLAYSLRNQNNVSSRFYECTAQQWKCKYRDDSSQNPLMPYLSTRHHYARIDNSQGCSCTPTRFSQPIPFPPEMQLFSEFGQGGGERHVMIGTSGLKELDKCSRRKSGRFSRQGLDHPHCYFEEQATSLVIDGRPACLHIEPPHEAYEFGVSSKWRRSGQLHLPRAHGPKCLALPVDIHLTHVSRRLIC